jgi:xylan 1,4-beta-xylosidase
VSEKADDKPFPKMLAYLKHYTAYNVETKRFTFSANVSDYDFWDSYLPQYEAAFTQGTPVLSPRFRFCLL